MIRAGILGLGYMGTVHTQKIAAVEGIRVDFVHDIDPGKKDVAEKAGYTFISDRSSFWARLVFIFFEPRLRQGIRHLNDETMTTQSRQIK